MVPSFLVHGDRDTFVHVRSSVKLYKKLKMFSVPSWIRIEHGADHSFEFVMKNRTTIKYIEETANFIRSVSRK